MAALGCTGLSIMQATGCHYTSSFPLHQLVTDVVIYYKQTCLLWLFYAQAAPSEETSPT